MPKFSRREFAARATAVLTATRAALAMEKLEAGNLGVQLYTVRNVILTDPAATLKAIQAIGYAEVEATYDKLNQIWPALQDTKLKRTSIHVDDALFMEGDGPLDTVLKDVKRRGFEYVVVPSLPTAKGGADGVKRLAQMLNKAGEQAKKRKLTLCYHNHAHDFQPIDGTPALEMLLSETHPELLSLEMDVFWVSVAGQDPVEMLKKHSGRVPLVHLKDKATGVPKQYNEEVPKDAFKEIGSGSIDIPAVLKAADAAGVKHYFVEQDQTPGDPVASLRQSYKYLSSMF
jgi:sugar phosphate isomerase/epimerase